jgi:hypothetical protein
LITVRFASVIWSDQNQAIKSCVRKDAIVGVVTVLFEAACARRRTGKGQKWADWSR